MAQAKPFCSDVARINVSCRSGKKIRRDCYGYREAWKRFAKPLLEHLETRYVMSSGVFVLHIDGLEGETDEERVEAIEVLLHTAGLQDDHVVAVGVLDSEDAEESAVLIQTPSDVTLDEVEQELMTIPGFVEVENFDPAGPGGDEDEEQENESDLNDLEEENGVNLPDSEDDSAPSDEDLSGANLAVGLTGNEPTIAVNPTNPNNVVVARHHTLKISLDGGASFPIQGDGTLPSGEALFDGDISAVFDPTGRLFVSYLTEGSTGPNVAVARFNPSTGAIISGPTLVATGSLDKAWIAADANNVYVIWHDFGISSNGPVRFSRSTDQGATWSAPVTLSGGASENFTWPSEIAAGPAGNVWVAWHTNTNSGNPALGEIRMRRSTDGGATFGSELIPFPAGTADATTNVNAPRVAGLQSWMQGSLQPRILVDPVRANTLYVIAADDPDNAFTATGDPSDIVIARSTDNGATWTRSTVSHGPSGTVQFMPAAAIDSNGNITVTWYDNRRGLTNAAGNYLLDVYASTSTDGGLTFGSDVRVNVFSEAQTLTPSGTITGGAFTVTLGGQTTAQNEVQTVTYAGATGGTFNLTFNGQTTSNLAFNASTTTVQNALNNLSTIGTAEVQNITFGGTITGGTFRLTFNAVQSAPITWSSNSTTLAGNIQAALNAMSSIGTGNSQVTGTGPFSVSYVSTLRGLDQPQITAQSSLTGSGTSITTNTITQGSGGVLVTGSTANYTLTFVNALQRIDVNQITATSSLTPAPITITTATTQTPLMFNSTAAQVQAALEKFTNIGLGNVQVSGGPLPSAALTATFIGTLTGIDVASMTTTSFLIGGGTMTAATATNGGPNSFDPDLGAPDRFPDNGDLRIGEYNGLASAGGSAYADWTGNTSTGQQTMFTKFPIGFQVASSTPSVGQLVTSPAPTDFLIQLTNPVAAGSVQASDLTVNGIAASSFVLNGPGDTITFRFNTSPVSVEGPQTLLIAAGALLRQADSAALVPYPMTFYYDPVPPAVVSTTPAIGGTFTLPGSFSFDVDFNEPVLSSSVQTSDLVLSGVSGTAVTAVAMQNSNTRAHFTINATGEGTLTARIAAGAITDPSGNPLAAFAANYQVDRASLAYPTTLVDYPLGSLIYDPTASGIVNLAGDTDNFTIAVDPGQTISVLVTADSATLQPTVRLNDPASVTLGSASASAAGKNAVLQTIPAATSGTYTITVGGAGSTIGNYTVHVYLNAAVEAADVGIGTDSTRATAQDLTAAFTTLQTGQASATRAAVVGRINPTSITLDATDWGWWNDSGNHTSNNKNYIVGLSAGTTFRDYFVFDLGTIAQPATLAVLKLQNPSGGYSSPDSSETYGVFDVGTSIDDLETTNSGQSAIFTDLGTGTSYGSRNYSSSDNNKVTSVTLNSNAVSAIGAAFGHSFAVGGAVTTISGTSTQDIFSGTGSTTLTKQLTLTLMNTDFYSFSMIAGERASVAIKNLLGSGTTLSIQDSNGATLATSVSAANVDQIIKNFVAPSTGTFYVVVTATGSATYDLVVTRDATFEAELNDSAATAEPLDLNTNVLGGITQPAIVPAPQAVTEGNSNNRYPFDIADTTPPVSSMRYQQIYSHTEFAQPGTITAIRFRRNGGSDATFTTPGINVKINLGYSALPLDSISGTFASNVAPGFTTVLDTPSLTLSSSGSGSPRPFDIVINLATPFTYDPSQGDLLMDIFMRNSPSTTLMDCSGSGEQLVTRRVYATNVLATTGSIDLSDDLDFGLMTRFDYAPNDDWYALEVSSTATPVRLQTSTPADGANQFVNTLNPHIELYDPSNSLVASGTTLADLHNESIQYQPLVTGTYRVRVSGESGTTGEYFLTTNDLRSPRVVATSIAPGAMLTPTGTLTYTITFSEPMNVGNLSSDDFSLRGIYRDVDYSAATSTFNAAGTVLTLTYTNLPDDSYRLTLVSGSSSFADTAGNVLDGDFTGSFPTGDGAAGGNFVAGFTTDFTTEAFPSPLMPVAPSGSLIYQHAMTRVIASATDSDGYTLVLDPNQTISVLITPGSASLQSVVQLKDPSNALLTSATAAGPGEPVLLQTVPASASGTYTISVNGAAGTTGPYTIQIYLNAAVETENNGGSDNNSIGNAQDLDGTAYNLGGGVARQAAVGDTSAVFASEDFESGVLPPSFATYSSNGFGRIQVAPPAGSGNTSGYALLMDSNTDGNYVLNEAVYTVNLAGLTHATLTFSHAAYADETDSLPLDFAGHANGDGVAISDDGQNWRTIFTPSNPLWTTARVDLGSAAAAAGMSLMANFQIKFQQYDNFSIPTDGRGYDDIKIIVPDSADYYKFTVASGESATVVVAGQDAANLGVELLSAADSVLATGSTGPTNLTQVINNFGPLSAGTYYVRVTGDGGAPYSLVVNKNASFDTEPNNSFGAAQDITGTRGVLGAISSSTAVVPGFYANVETGGQNGYPFDLAVTSPPVPSMRYQQIYSHNDFLRGGIIDAVRFRRATGQAPFTSAPIDVQITLSYAAHTPESASSIFADNIGPGAVTVLDTPSLILSSGGSGTPNPFDIVIDVDNLFNYDPSQGDLLLDVTVRNSASSGFFASTGTSGTETTTARVYATSATATSGSIGFSSSQLPLYGLVTRFDLLPTTSDDWYAVNVTSSSPNLQLQTSTPGDGPNQFANTLNPRLDVFGPAGNLISGSTILADGRNESIQLHASGAAPGIYRVHILGESNTSGEYFLALTTLPNQSPVAGDDAGATSEDSAVTITVLANDADADGSVDPSSVAIASGPAHGTVTINATSGQITYTPSSNYSGADSFTYTVQDDNGAISNIAVVSLSITAVADAPTLSVADATGMEGQPTALNIAAALTDTDGSESLSIQIAGVPASASLSAGTNNGDGTWTLAPSDLNGLTITIAEEGSYPLAVSATSKEASNGDSATTAASLLVSVLDVAPTLTLASSAASAAENASATNSGSFADYDDAVIITASSGSVSQSGTQNGTWSWFGTGDEDHPYSVTITATNADGSTATTTFAVSFTDVRPTVAANSPSVIAAENTSATNGGTFADYDDAVTLTASFGTVTQSGSQTGSWTWSGTGDEDTPYSVTITATNADGSAATTTFAVSFTDVPPNVAANSPSVSAAENAAATNSGTWSDYDDAVTLSTSSGTLTQNADGTWSWSGTGDEDHPYSVNITATNADGSTATTTFAVSFTDVPPTVAATNSTIAINEGQSATNTGSFADYDDAVTLTASAGTITKSGTTSGTWSWSKHYGDNGSDTIIVTATNADGSTATTSFTVTVNNVAPTATPDQYSTAQAMAVSGNVITDNTGSGADSDPAGANDPLTVSSHTGPANGTLVLNPNGSFTYTPNSTFSGADFFTYTISDGDGGSATATVTIIVLAAAPGSIHTIPDSCLGGTALLVTGTAANDTIIVEPGSSASTLKVTINGVSTTVARPSGRVIVTGGTGDDNIQIAGAIANPVWLYGEAGNDRLNAGNGGSLLIGGDGNDQLLGGSGRDVMIGGKGADSLVGNSDDDILIAGYTDEDSRASAGHDDFWCQVLHEWNSSDSFARRVQMLHPVLVPIFHDDHFADAVDFLNGASGIDWLLFTTGEDKVAGQAEATN